MAKGHAVRERLESRCQTQYYFSIFLIDIDRLDEVFKGRNKIVVSKSEIYDLIGKLSASVVATDEAIAAYSGELERYVSTRAAHQLANEIVKEFKDVE
jgi:hypothetical protein